MGYLQNLKLLRFYIVFFNKFGQFTFLDENGSSKFLSYLLAIFSYVIMNIAIIVIIIMTVSSLLVAAGHVATLS